MISIIEIGRDSHFMPKAGDVPDKSHRQVRFFLHSPLCIFAEGRRG